MGKILDLAKSLASELQLASRHGHWILAVSQAADQIISFAAGEVNALAGPGLVPDGTQLAVGQNPDNSIIVNGDNIRVNPTIQAGSAAGATAVQPTRTLTAGAGLTGGGDLSANRTFDVVANADGTILVNANDLQINPALGVGNVASRAQTVWFIDPVAGSDANDGLTAGTAIQHDAERQRRVGTIWNIVADTTVTYLNNVPATDPCIFNFILGSAGVLRITGVATTTYTSPGGGFSAVTNLNRATQTASAITEAGLGAGRTGQRIRATSGASTGAIAWLDRDFGGGVYRTSPWTTMSFAANPLPFTPTPVNVAAGNTFVVESLTTIGYLTLNNISAQYGGAASVNGTQIVLQNVYLTQSDIPISMLPIGTVTNAPVAYGCRMHPPFNANLCGCFIDTGVVIAAAPSSPSFFACLVRGRPSVQSGATLFVDYDTLFSQSGNDGIRVRYNGVLRVATMAVFDAGADGLLIEDGNVRAAALFSGNDLIWGTGSTGVGMRVRSGGKTMYTTKPTVTGASDANVGGTARTWAQIPYMNGYDGVTVGTGNGAMIVAFA